MFIIKISYKVCNSDQCKCTICFQYLSFPQNLSAMMMLVIYENMLATRLDETVHQLHNACLQFKLLWIRCTWPVTQTGGVWKIVTPKKCVQLHKV